MELHLIFNEGLTNSSNPNFTFKRGGTYTLICLQGILLNTVQGTGTANAYASGVTNNGAAGTITLLFL
jgi:hypothetical protein